MLKASKPPPPPANLKNQTVSPVQMLLVGWCDWEKHLSRSDYSNGLKRPYGLVGLSTTLAATFSLSHEIFTKLVRVPLSFLRVRCAARSNGNLRRRRTTCSQKRKTKSQNSTWSDKLRFWVEGRKRYARSRLYG